MKRMIECPYCGGDGNYHGDNDCGMIGIGCGDCNGEGRIPDRRAPTASEDALRAENAALRARAEAAEKRLERVESWAAANLDDGCSCSSEYRDRETIDPRCEWHELHTEILDTILAPDQKGDTP